VSNDAAPRKSDAPINIGRRLAHGTAWMIAMRFTIRGIGLVSTIILARLLTPADFGIVAMAMLLISFIEVFNETGQQAALIAHPNPERSHYDSAWTVTVMIGCVLTAILLAVAPFADMYFDDARIVPVIQVLSLRVLLGSFMNIGVVDFRRNLDFAREFRFGLARRIATFTTTLTLALIWRDYWALVIGTVTGHLMEVGMSYIAHRYRPRFSLAKVREIWGYSIWLLVQSVGRFFENRTDEVVVGGIAPPTQMGHYTVAAELGALPMTELVEPAGRALFPNYATIAANPLVLRDTYLQVFAAAVSVCACMGTGLILVADDFVVVLLGAQWADSASLLVWFAAAGAVTGVCNTVYAVFNVVGKTRLSAKQTWLRVAALVPAVAWAASTGELRNFAIARFVVAVVLAPTFFFRLSRIIPITVGQLAAAIWRPVLSAVVMAVALTVIDFPAHVSAVSLRLMCEVATGGAVYVVTQLCLWKLVGSPISVESAVLNLCGYKTSRVIP